MLVVLQTSQHYHAQHNFRVRKETAFGKHLQSNRRMPGALLTATTTATATTMTSELKLSSKQCGACCITFPSDEIRRAHSKTPWQ